MRKGLGFNNGQSYDAKCFMEFSYISFIHKHVSWRERSHKNCCPFYSSSYRQQPGSTTMGVHTHGVDLSRGEFPRMRSKKMRFILTRSKDLLVFLYQYFSVCDFVSHTKSNDDTSSNIIIEKISNLKQSHGLLKSKSS